MPNKVCVLIFTCDRPDDLKHCLESVLKQTFSDFEVIVVDNGASIQTDELLRNYRSRVIKDRTKKLSYLFNLGYRATGAELIVYLADDVELDHNWLQEGLDTFRRHLQAAVVTGPLISAFEFTGEMHLLHARAIKNKFLRLIAKIYDNFILEGKTFEPCVLCESGSYTLGQGFKPKFSEDREVDLATTSGMLIKRSAIEAIGGFDENFIFNHADGDLFVRLKKSGYKIIYNPRMLGKHYNRPGPSRYPFFIGRDTAYFYLKDIRPRSLKGFFAVLVSIIILNLYWIYNSLSLKDLAQLKGILGFLCGFFAFLAGRRK